MIFENGHSEPLKSAVHAALGTLALVCLGYNCIAFGLRRERHLAINAVLYLGLVVVEKRQVQSHARKTVLRGSVGGLGAQCPAA